MKTIFTMIMMLTALLLTGCESVELREKDRGISQLKKELASQQGTHKADLEYAEQQMGFYLGCKEFFNHCSPEITAQGQKLMQLGITGTKSGWYWAGLLGAPLSIAMAVAVFMALGMHLFLNFIAPKADEVEQARKLVDGLDEYVADGKRWIAAHEQKMGIRNSELTKVNSQIKNQKRERNEVTRTLLEISAELELAKAQLKAIQKQKTDAKGFEDY